MSYSLLGQKKRARLISCSKQKQEFLPRPGITHSGFGQPPFC